jgi:hypothetical protein
MKVFRHFIKIAKGFWQRISCTHEDADSASCPFTGMTYTTCRNCYTRVRAERTL